MMKYNSPRDSDGSVDFWEWFYKVNYKADILNLNPDKDYNEELNKELNKEKKYYNKRDKTTKDSFMISQIKSQKNRIKALEKIIAEYDN